MKDKVLRFFGTEYLDANNVDKAYKILVDSLAFIFSTLGFKLGVEGVMDILGRIGVSVDESVTRDVIHDVGEQLGRVSYETLKLYQYEVPQLLTPGSRKRLAAYYTGPLGTRIMSYLAREFIERTGRNSIVIADPFMGTAVTLTNAIRSLGIHRVRRVWGIEKHPLACIVAYASLLGVCGGIDDIVSVRCGDSFEIIWGNITQDMFFRGSVIYKADVVLTNPPFTRWEELSRSYREFLRRAVAATGYLRYVSRMQANLQVLSLFLIDAVLEEGGLLIAVLPASTFYTIYGQGVKTLLREKYNIAALIQGATPVFSIDSGFKEVILVAMKSQGHRGKTAFITIDDEKPLDISILPKYILGASPSYEAHGYKVNLVDLHRLPHILDMNWLLLFEEGGVRRLVVDIILNGLREGTLSLWRDALGRQSIVRGVEMYGPDFFLLPNSYWAIEEEHRDEVVVRNVYTGEVLEIRREYLLPTLRRPGLYVDRIVVQPDHYLVAIPPKDLESLPKDILRYIEWGVKASTASPAIRSFGRYWYAHVYRQVQSKKPYGHLFLPDKVDATFRNRGVFALMSLDRATATKNFYIMINNSRYTPLLALWFNSSLFLLLFIHGSRKIGETWTRFLENDYLNMPIPNPEIAETYLEEALTLINSFKNLTLPPLKHQLYKDYRREIDELIAKTLGLHNPRGFAEKLHDLLAEAL
ncbi:MAG: N-6 DNA methylase [Sulfolobales archaeon]